MVGESPKFAVLIDGDNVSADAMDALFATVAKLGVPVVRIVYGSQTSSRKWEKAATRHALSFGRRNLHAKGCNATDIEMVIGAMDLLCEEHIDGFWLVSSDSDFTPLAIRLREAGKTVYGYGRSASDGFRNACHKFFLLDGGRTVADNIIPFPFSDLDTAIAGLRRAIAKHEVAGGWALLSMVGSALGKEIPGFSVKDYGEKSLAKLADKARCFEVKQQQGGAVVIRVREAR